MSWLGKEMIIDSLMELGSKQLQEARWLSDGSSDFSSFTEATEQLFTDSGLGITLEKRQEVFSTKIDHQLRELDAMLSAIDVDRPPSEIIDDPRMLSVREKSNEILKALDG